MSTTQPTQSGGQRPPQQNQAALLNAVAKAVRESFQAQERMVAAEREKWLKQATAALSASAEEKRLSLEKEAAAITQGVAELKAMALKATKESERLATLVAEQKKLIEEAERQKAELAEQAEEAQKFLNLRAIYENKIVEEAQKKLILKAELEEAQQRYKDQLELVEFDKEAREAAMVAAMGRFAPELEEKLQELEDMARGDIEEDRMVEKGEQQQKKTRSSRKKAAPKTASRQKPSQSDFQLSPLEEFE